MPFRDTTFNPEELALLQKVLDDICRQMNEAGRAPDEAARARLARRLIQFAQTGERDPEKLMLYMLGNIY